MANNQKLLFIINPGAGTSNNSSWKENIDNYFFEKGFLLDFFLLPEKFDTKEIKAYITQSAADKVIVVGGDGTVTMIANILAGTGIPLGILPGGSANGMAKELGISNIPEEALSIIENGKVKPCDLIGINDKNICLHLSDIGLNAQLIKHFDEGKLRGKMGYAKVILKTLWHKQKMLVTIYTKEVMVRRNAFMVVLANASMYGTGAVINPQGQLDDGLFEVVIVRRLSLWALFKMLFKPGIFNPKHIEIFPSTSVEIKTTRKVPFQIDGEYMGKIKNITAKILPGHIHLILPE